MHLTTLRPAAIPLWLSTLLVPVDAAGQASGAPANRYRLEEVARPPLLGAGGLLAVNAVLGGVSAGLIRELRGGSFREGAFGGALGGGVVFLGKTVAAQRFSGAGLVGRQLAAVGGSMASNAAADTGLLARVLLPLGPARLEFGRGAGGFSLRVDPVGLAVLAYAVLDSHYRLNAAASLSAGTPVFDADAPTLQVPLTGASAVGLELHSVILLADMSGLEPGTRADVFAHERVHTLQADAFQALWGRALLEWVVPDSPGWERALGVLDLNFGKATAELADRLFFGRGLWEVEAEYIGR